MTWQMQKRSTFGTDIDFGKGDVLILAGMKFRHHAETMLQSTA